MREEIIEEKHFVLSEDFYALTFSAYIKENAKKYELSPERQARYF
jgi:hypothetical protein